MFRESLLIGIQNASRALPFPGGRRSRPGCLHQRTNACSLSPFLRAQIAMLEMLCLCCAGVRNCIKVEIKIK